MLWMPFHVGKLFQLFLWLPSFSMHGKKRIYCLTSPSPPPISFWLLCWYLPQTPCSDKHCSHRRNQWEEIKKLKQEPTQQKSYALGISPHSQDSGKFFYLDPLTHSYLFLKFHFLSVSSFSLFPCWWGPVASIVGLPVFHVAPSSRDSSLNLILIPFWLFPFVQSDPTLFHISF